jgi:type IV secretory pathway component VirB8
MDPVFVIQNKWESFQSYHHNYLKDYVQHFMNNKIHFITMQYVPKEEKNTAELNFHLTQKEKEDIYNSIYSPVNQQEIRETLELLQ